MNDPPPPPPRTPAWTWLALLAILLFDVWWRGHTFGPSVRERWGLDPWPVSGLESEPLDCDEAAYAYMGRRITRGDVLYRDLTENKPPLGYWLYALAVAVGGAEELAIRAMPIPMVLATIAMLWWIALRLSGPLAATLSAGTYAVASTDPYVYGNGANLEHAINFFSVASLALMVRAWRREGRGPIVAAGAFAGAASLVKQVAITHLLVYGSALLLRRRGEGARGRGLDLVALLRGFAATWLVAVAVLLVRGAGPAAFDDIVRYGGALATDTPPEPNAPPFPVRLVVGNADPRDGDFPWPFGATTWLVWWGAGTWPLWLAAIPAVARLLIRPTDGPRRLVAGWTISAVVQVALPGLFWAHYYLLPMPGVALCVALLTAEAIAQARAAGKRSSLGRRGVGALAAALLAAAMGWTIVIQVRDYLLVKPQMLTALYKGGGQWIAQRSLGRIIGHRARAWPSPRLFVWGAASPLFLYSGLDGVTKHFFADPLLKAYAGTDHPLIRPRVRKIVADLNARPPELIFLYDPPFRELADFLLSRGYRRSRLSPVPAEGPGSADLRGLWVEPGRYDLFEDPSSGGPERPGAADARRPPPVPTSAARPAAADGGLSPARIAKVEAVIAGVTSQRGIPGLSAALVVDGRPRWSRGFGLADVENDVPATAETVYRLASISKPITAVAVLQLVEAGKIDLDATIQTYVPNYPEKRWPVTPRQLLGHLGGVRHYVRDEMHSTWHYFGPRHALSVFRDDPLVHEPGTKYLYSTYGFNLLGVAVMTASGGRFADYLREHIFKPAHMDHARADDPYAVIPHRAAGYLRFGAGQLYNSALADVSNRIPGSGLCGTAEDVARFAAAVMSDALVKPGTRAMMFTSQATADGEPTGYGMGWCVGERNGKREVWHLGAMPMVSNVLLIRPEDRDAVVLLSNLEGQAPRLHTLAREIADELTASPASREAVARNRPE